jgi:hypothetical protein
VRGNRHGGRSQLVIAGCSTVTASVSSIAATSLVGVEPWPEYVRAVVIRPVADCVPVVGLLIERRCLSSYP